MAISVCLWVNYTHNKPKLNFNNGKQLFGSNLVGSGLGEHRQNFGTPLCISATVESNDFKFGIQLAFVE